MTDFDDRALLLALLDAAADAILISDCHGAIIRANPVVAQMFGHAETDLIGRNVSLLMTDDMAARHDGFMAHHLETGETRIIGRGRDVEGRRADGSVFPLHLSVGRAEIDGAVAFVAILQDQTRKRATEEAMARSQRMDAIGQMTGGIAHDFNNLLTVVIGNLELLETSDIAGQNGPLIRDALEAAELGADLTSRLMVFSRKSSLRPKAIGLKGIVERSLALLRRTIGAHCRLDTALVTDLWPAEVDPTQLQTAILNLALNAQDALPNGGKILVETGNIVIDDSYVGQEIDVATGSYVRLSVSDNGDGMTPEAQRRALEPFFTTKPVGKGTGLGLSMVYGFVRQSGGHLTIYSELGQGTTISLYFPATDRARDDDFADQSPAARQPSIGDGRVALVVEDNLRVMRLSKARLGELGFDCLTATTADAAWQILNRRDDIALVFTDLVMPGEMSGNDLAKRIAADMPNIRVLLTSGFSEGVLRDDRIGPETSILNKPYRRADLVAALGAVFDDKNG